MSKKVIYGIGVMLAVVVILSVVFWVFGGEKDNVQNSANQKSESASSQNLSQADQNQSLSSKNEQSENLASSNSSISADNNTQTQVFTAEKLATFNGKNRNGCYVSVDKVVYDLTNFPESWENGEHTPTNGRVKCGTDGTAAINSAPHGKAILSRVPVVGKM
jgi:predicted heme/steroid binding protein